MLVCSVILFCNVGGDIFHCLKCIEVTKYFFYVQVLLWYRAKADFKFITHLALETGNKFYLSVCVTGQHFSERWKFFILLRKKKRTHEGKFTFDASIDQSPLHSVIALFTVFSFPVDQIDCLMYSPNLTQWCW